jgi:hypothetical protein
LFLEIGRSLISKIKKKKESKVEEAINKNQRAAQQWHTEEG